MSVDLSVCLRLSSETVSTRKVHSSQKPLSESAYSGNCGTLHCTWIDMHLANFDGEKVEYVKEYLDSLFTNDSKHDKDIESDRERCGLKEDVVTRVERSMARWPRYRNILERSMLRWRGHLERMNEIKLIKQKQMCVMERVRIRLRIPVTLVFVPLLYLVLTLVLPSFKKKGSQQAKETTRKSLKPSTPLRHAGSTASALGEDVTTIMSILHVVRSTEVSDLAVKFRKAKHGVDRLRIILDNQDLINGVENL
ncbi:hypothetical protein EVAR_45656_1 [Eumeta japonica]|uniref:Uncharacterized protein n=1 Tax=Eumeta variegata TaxID=151549 RepID=A0A4C1Y741_EUMVA|nr:hypothetical protein EVAR_45656_1 [Eumeta japonica]